MAAAAIVLVAAIVLTVVLVIGSGKTAPTKNFKLIMNDTENSLQYSYNLSSTEQYIADALLGCSIIVGTKDGTTFTIEKVDGVKANASKYQYWAIHLNGDRIDQGALNTELTNGDVIELRLEYLQ